MNTWLGMRMPVAANWPGPRMAWLRRVRMADLQRSRWIFQPRDYLLWRLTAQAATDPLSSRGAVHLPSGIPAANLFRLTGIRLELWPPVLQPTTGVGGMTPAAAAATGLRAGTPVVLGCNDLSAALLGSGVVRAGQGFVLTGTSEHTGMLAAGPISGTATLMDVPIAADLRQVYGATASAGPALAWAARLLCGQRDEAAPGPAEVRRLLRLAAAEPPRNPRPVVLPYLQGERAPLWDPAARGAWVGLTTADGPAALARAVLESIAFSSRHVLEHVEEAAGTPAELRLAGGLAAEPFWAALRATVLGRPLQVVREAEAGCLGAAILAAVGTGEYRNLVEAVERMTQPPITVTPVADEAKVLDELYALYRELYPALRAIMHRLAQPI
jgi:xylulokinase